MALSDGREIHDEGTDSVSDSCIRPGRTSPPNFDIAGDRVAISGISFTGEQHEL